MTSEAGLFIDANYSRDMSPANMRAQLADIFKSTDFTLCDQTGQVCLQGSRGDHLRIDPDLKAVCLEAGFTVPDDTPGFHISRGSIDFCLEDGLSGMFIARTMSKGRQDDWVILHLDDHRDMMPTLLAKEADGRLYDPETGGLFDSQNALDWHTALLRGTLTIGNYLVPILHDRPSGRKLHIRHFHNDRNETEASVLLDLIPTVKSYPMFENILFASCTFAYSAEDHVGTFSHHSRYDILLDGLPSGRVIIHIDIDFFINDLNGNPGRLPRDLGMKERAIVLKRMDDFFAQIERLDRPVERWVIATSPGFCAAKHWSWLISALSARISALKGDEKIDFFG